MNIFKKDLKKYIYIYLYWNFVKNKLFLCGVWWDGWDLCCVSYLKNMHEIRVEHDFEILKCDNLKKKEYRNKEN